eukprot:3593623-Amphidinium_carterae.1
MCSTCCDWPLAIASNLPIWLLHIVVEYAVRERARRLHLHGALSIREQQGAFCDRGAVKGPSILQEQWTRPGNS